MNQKEGMKNDTNRTNKKSATGPDDRVRVMHDPERGPVGCKVPPARPDQWDRPRSGPTNPRFEAAVKEVYQAVDQLNRACADFHQTQDLLRYEAEAEYYNKRMQKLIETYQDLRLEKPTLLSDGRFVRTFILQQKEKGNLITSHSSSSVGWP